MGFVQISPGDGASAGMHKKIGRPAEFIRSASPFSGKSVLLHSNVDGEPIVKFSTFSALGLQIIST